jgi:hypothetical protein
LRERRVKAMPTERGFPTCVKSRGVKTQPLPWPNIIALAFGSMTCVDFNCPFMLKKVVFFYNIKSILSSFNQNTNGFAT